MWQRLRLTPPAWDFERPLIDDLEGVLDFFLRCCISSDLLDQADKSNWEWILHCTCCSGKICKLSRPVAISTGVCNLRSMTCRASGLCLARKSAVSAWPCKISRSSQQSQTECWLNPGTVDEGQSSWTKSPSMLKVAGDESYEVSQLNDNVVCRWLFFNHKSSNASGQISVIPPYLLKGQVGFSFPHWQLLDSSRYAQPRDSHPPWSEKISSRLRKGSETCDAALCRGVSPSASCRRLSAPLLNLHELQAQWRWQPMAGIALEMAEQVLLGYKHLFWVVQTFKACKPTKVIQVKAHNSRTTSVWPVKAALCRLVALLDFMHLFGSAPTFMQAVKLTILPLLIRWKPYDKLNFALKCPWQVVLLLGSMQYAHRQWC